MTPKARKNIIIVLIAGIFAIIVPSTLVTWFIYESEPPAAHGSVTFGIPYNKNHTLDIYKPTVHVSSNSPVLFFVHGGAWITGDKLAINVNRFNDAINTLRQEGYTIIAPNYTLSRKKASPFPYCVIDIFDALEWTVANADSLNIDPENIVFMGESAGAHIAMLAAFAEPADFGLPYEKVRALKVIDVYGPTHLYSLYHSGKVDTANAVIDLLPKQLSSNLDLPNILFGFNPDTNDSLAQSFSSKYSPVSYVNESSPSTLIIHGMNDVLVPISQSDTLLSILNKNKVESHSHYMTNTNHSFIKASKEQKKRVQSWITEFVLDQ